MLAGGLRHRQKPQGSAPTCKGLTTWLEVPTFLHFKGPLECCQEAERDVEEFGFELRSKPRQPLSRAISTV